jgi:hypothetical protein
VNSSRWSRAAMVAAPLALLMTLLSSGTTSAHFPVTAGPYTIEVGWKNEPAYVGQQNAVLVIVTDADDKPVTDLPADALSVVVSTGGQQSTALPFEPAFDAAEGEGTLGEYDAAILPTAPGGYDFHITGTIHEQTVDLTVKSTDTQEPVSGTSDIEFPTKLPSLTEIATRLDRIDGRIETLSAGGGNQAALDAAMAAAAQARDDAQFALIIGSSVGFAGLLVGALAVWLTLRARPRSA